VPFVCVHTADTNNGWKGAYGRLWLGACGGALLTTLALPSKGGAYIHPRQQRLYSAREAARLQGFGDGFRLGVDEAVVAAAARAGTARAGAAGGGRFEAVTEEDEDGERDEEEVEARGGHGDGGGNGSVGAAILTALLAVGNAVPPPFGAALARAMTRSAEGAALLGR
jgi:site-specific DNA-cytosine methylase